MSPVISICGSNGVGKTALAQVLCKEGYGEVVNDQTNDYPYRQDFFLDKLRWSFHNQCQYILHKFKQQEVARATNAQKPTYQVRSAYDCYEVFSRKLFDDGLMTPRDFQCLAELYTFVSAYIPPPTLIIHVKAPPQLLLKRIQRRGRAIDHDITMAYLTDLEKRYEHWIEHVSPCPVLQVDTGKLDYISNLTDKKKVLGEIDKRMLSWSTSILHSEVTRERNIVY